MAKKCKYSKCNLPVRQLRAGRTSESFCYGHTVISFIEKHCKHTTGKQWAGVPFTLMDWQRDLLMRGFGNTDENGTRKIRTIYCEVPKKNGKTELAACIALYGLVADGELGAQVFSAANDREQASYVYTPASFMVNNSKVLSGRLKIIDSRKRIIDHRTNSYYQVLSNDVPTKHGLNPSTITIDELHAHTKRSLYDTLVEGTDYAREQQIIFIITTAGIHDPTSIGWEVHHYAEQVKRGIIEDPTFLPIIYSVDHEADWRDQNLWAEVNPALGHVFDFDKLIRDYKKVKAVPSRENDFRRFRLNQWVGQYTRYIPMNHWDACSSPKINWEDLRGAICYGGLDLATTNDLCAKCLVFPLDEKFAIKPTFYLPEEAIKEATEQYRENYETWTRAGLIKTTPGRVIDYGFILEDIKKDCLRYDLKQMAYDRWGSQKIYQDLIEMGFEEEKNKHAQRHLVQFGQGYQSMSPPTKDLLKLVLEHRLIHNGHPVLRWNADNLVVQQNAAAGVKPDKEKSTQKIDGIVATIMALDRALRLAGEKSVYETRGVIAL